MELVSIIQGSEKGIASVIPFSNNKIITSSLDKKLQIWNLEAKSLQSTFNTNHFINHITLFRDGGNKTGICVGENPIEIWDFEKGKVTSEIQFDRDPELDSEIYSAIFFSDEKHFITALSDHTIRIFDLESKKCTKTLKKHEEIVIDVILFANDKRAISSSYDGNIGIWNLDSDECDMFGNNFYAITSSALFSDEEKVVTGMADGELKIWDLESRKAILNYQKHDAIITRIDFIDGNNCIISASEDKTFKIWDMRTNNSCSNFYCPDNTYIETFSILPNKKIAAGCDNGKIMIFDLGM